MMGVFWYLAACVGLSGHPETRVCWVQPGTSREECISTMNAQVDVVNAILPKGMYWYRATCDRTVNKV